MTPREDEALAIEREELDASERDVRGVLWLLLLLVVLYLFVADREALGSTPMLGSLGALALFTLLFGYTGVLESRRPLKLGLEVAVMIAFVTAVAVRTGLASSPLLTLYLLPAAAAALTLGRAPTVLALLTVTGAYLALVVAAAPGLPPMVLLGQAMAVLGPVWLVALLASTLAERAARARRRIRELADSDHETGLLNAGAVRRELARLHERARATGHPWALLALEIDALPRLSEAYGAETAGRALALVAAALRRSLRRSDRVGRFGTAGFLVLMPEADKPAALEAAQRLRNVVWSQTLACGSRMERLKVSVGVATYPGSGKEVVELVEAAEQAMREDRSFRRTPGSLVVRHRQVGPAADV